MAKTNVIDAILKTINEVQRKNKANPKQQTADASVFDLIRSKLQNLGQKNSKPVSARTKKPSSIFDMIKKEIGGAKRENKKDPKVETAPGSIFDEILSKIDQKPQRQASSGVKRIIEEYNLDVSRLPKDVLQQVQQKYAADQKNFDQQYAQAIHDLARKY